MILTAKVSPLELETPNPDGRQMLDHLAILRLGIAVRQT